MLIIFCYWTFCCHSIEFQTNWDPLVVFQISMYPYWLPKKENLQMPIKLFTNCNIFGYGPIIMSKSKLLTSSKYPGLDICTMSSHWKNAVTTCQMAPTGWPIRIIIPHCIFTLKLLFGASTWHLIVSTILFCNYPKTYWAIHRMGQHQLCLLWLLYKISMTTAHNRLYGIENTQ